MTLGEARALCAIVQHEEHDPSRDSQSLEALARWMFRFSPVVSLPTWNNHSEQVDHGIFLDLTGCERVFRGLHNIVSRIRRALAKMRITANLAIAPTVGAAWAMTFHPGVSVCNDERHIPSSIADLPPVALRLDSETVEALHHLGLETIGQLTSLPRDLLPARFGPLLSLRITEALGEIPEPLVPLEPPISIKARMDFDGLVESLEAIWIVFRKLIEQIIRQLLRHGRGAREIEVEFYRAYATTLRTTVRLSRPSRDPSNLFNLLRCAMETIETDEGFLGIALIVTSSERVSDDQIHLLGGDEFEAQVELDHLIERLRVRLGETIVAQPALVESYVPECSFSLSPRGERAGVRDERSRTRSSSVREFPPHPNPLPSGEREIVRPLHLLHRPIEIRVMVSPSHDRDGRPISFALRGEVHRLLHTVGPERIAGQWWQGHFKTRDYFDIEDDSGKRFWIFRVTESGKWFLHGEFE
jgi:protein ImuB